MSVLDLLGDAAGALLEWATYERRSERRWVNRLRRTVLFFGIACASMLPVMFILHLLGVI